MNMTALGAAMARGAMLIACFCCSATLMARVDLTVGSSAGKGAAGDAGRIRQMGGIAVGVGLAIQASSRWEFVPGLEAAVQKGSIVSDGGSVRRTAALELRSLAAFTKAAYRVPFSGDDPVRIYACGGLGSVWGKMLVDRTQSDIYEQFSYDGMRGRLISYGLGVDVPLMELLSVSLEGRQTRYDLPIGHLASEGDVEEVRGGTALRYARESTIAGLGYEDNVTLATQSVVLGLMIAL